MRAALNATLPPDIRVRAASWAPEGFDARRSARIKRYGYLIETGDVVSPFARRYAWHVRGRLDLGAMRRGLGVLRGKQDFAAFCAAAGLGRDPVCAVRSVRLVRRGSRVGVLLSADRFLHHMVRIIVGTAVEVGLGRRPPESVTRVLAGGDRRQAGPTAPAHGLFLLGALYEPPVFAGGQPRVMAP